MSEVIIIRGRIYDFPRLKYETNQSYNMRKNYIIKHIPNTNNEFNNSIKMSIMLVYSNFLQCRYNI